MRLYVNLRNGKTYDYKLRDAGNTDIMGIVERAKLVHENWSSMIVTIIRKDKYNADYLPPETPIMDGNGYDRRIIESTIQYNLAAGNAGHGNGDKEQ